MQVAASLERAGDRIALARTVEVLDASICGLPVARLTGLTPAPGSSSGGHDHVSVS